VDRRSQAGEKPSRAAGRHRQHLLIGPWLLACAVIAWLSGTGLDLILEMGEQAEAERRDRFSADPGEMVSIPAGLTWLGCVDHLDDQCEEREKPGRAVRVEAFRIDRREVSVEQYRVCVQAGACTSAGLRRPVWFHGERHPEFAWSCNWGRRGREQHPINCVSWFQAEAYCRWRGKRLPSDAEWEKAARGESPRVYPWGDRATLESPGVALANIADRSARRRFPEWPSTADFDDGAVGTAPVGSYPAGASPYGVLDMIGNVEEWTASWYDRQKGLRSIRGSSWHRGPEVARISRLYPSEPGSQPDYGGFRCAADDSSGEREPATGAQPGAGTGASVTSSRARDTHPGRGVSAAFPRDAGARMPVHRAVPSRGAVGKSSVLASRLSRPREIPPRERMHARQAS
jgi:formylglycine-generating enzyme required for sulfatase activity